MKWINCSDRLPKRKDGDSCGNVVCRRLESGKWSLFVEYCEDAKDYAHQWLEGACEEATSDVMRLDSAGRDVTCLPGLWDDSDEVKKDESK